MSMFGWLEVWLPSEETLAKLHLKSRTRMCRYTLTSF
jgi:hypothetical protein